MILLIRKIIFYAVIIVFFCGAYIEGEGSFANENDQTGFDGVAWSERSTDDLQKEWTISFSSQVMPEDENLQNIYVEDSCGNQVEVERKLGHDKTSVEVSPEKPYEPGNTYYLWISSEIMSVGTSKMKEDVRMPFCIQEQQSSQNVEEDLGNGWILETIVEPSVLGGAPFDVVSCPDGRILAKGPGVKFISIDKDGNGNHEESEIWAPGDYYDASDDGRIWCYNFFAGELYVVHQGMHSFPQPLASIPRSYCGGAVSVAPDGSEAYVIVHENMGERASLHKYDAGEEDMQYLLSVDEENMIYGLEVARDGNLYIAGKKGVYVLGQDDGLEAFVLWENDKYLSFDCMTSDKDGNLYVGGSDGFFMINGEGDVSCIAQVKGQTCYENDSLGLAYDEDTGCLFSAAKESQNIYSIENGQISAILDPSGLVVPIAIATGPSGEVYVNGDELGVVRVYAGGSVERVCTRPQSDIVCYQPPAAGMCVQDSGEIYFTESAPGFESFISRIDQHGEIERVISLGDIESSSPAGICVSEDGNVYYADFAKDSICRAGEGEFEVVVDGVENPVGLFTRDGKVFWASLAPEEKRSSERIVKISGGVQTDVYLASSEGLTFFDVDEGGRLYVPDGDKIVLVSEDGSEEILAEGFNSLKAAKLASDGSVYFTDYGDSALYRLRKKNRLKEENYE